MSYKHNLYALATAGCLLLGACGKFVDGYENSPNEPSESSPKLLLTVSQVQTFLSYSGNLARVSSIFVQQQNGTDSQYESFANFNLNSGDNDNEWENIYSAMLDAKTLTEKAGVSNPYYSGMGRVLLGMNLGLATDLWGDVPYSQALKGLTNGLAPTYDSQESVLNAIQDLMDKALVDFSKTESANLLPVPLDNDLIFSGVIDNWKIAAYTLKARYANRLSRRDPSGSATKVLAYVDSALALGASTSTDCNAKFGVAGNEYNQWYAFTVNDRQGYMQMGAFFVDKLAAMNDPRLSFYATLDTGSAYRGTPLGSTDKTTSAIGAYFASANSSAPMATFVELKFLEAEAAFRANDKTRAATAYNNAVTVHIQQVTGASPSAAYITAHISETSTTISLEKIMTQKYIAGFTQIEVWSDWRRTGFPTLSLSPSAFTSEIPRRLPTPLTEANYNPNTPKPLVSGRSIINRVWWDAQ
jgi:Starch-binding associating with outer membrane